MTDKPSLPALREAVAKMTPGPWEYDTETHGVYNAEVGYGIVDAEPKDAAGIVALRNAAPALLDELEALKARTCKTCRYVMPDWSSAPTHGTCGVSGLFCQTHGFTCGAWQQKDEGHP